MRIFFNNTVISLGILLPVLFLASCKKLVTVDEPNNTITTPQIFKNDIQAQGAMAGIYSRMINGENISSSSFDNVFSAGLSTLLGSLSSDELSNYSGPGNSTYYAFESNRLTTANSGLSDGVWTSAYSFVYAANSVIEGIAASRSDALTDSTRAQLTAEAKFVRAFCYFYLVNFFGDVPLVLTIDFNKTVNLKRASRAQVYQQMIEDLQEAKNVLPADYLINGGLRIRPNRWAAIALLSRVFLYINDHENAAASASELINNTELFGLEELENVFLTGSREAIWQLAQPSEHNGFLNATPEGYSLNPAPSYTGIAPFIITQQLRASFEADDKRWIEWTDSTDNSSNTGIPQEITHHPHKYKLGSGNAEFGVPPSEYYMVLRLAEIILIRAEARANGADGGFTNAISDLNRIRQRAGLTDLPSTLTQEETISAVAKERQAELFAEWAHRWFDLKRTTAAVSAFSAIPTKQPWLGDYQLLYPIPTREIQANPLLSQNTGY